MGVLRLFQLIKEHSPEAIREIDISEYMNKKVAIDSYLVFIILIKTIYQYLIATKSIKEEKIRELTDKDGNPTAHLMGILNRSLHLMKKGIRPCWVFDGKPPLEKEKILLNRFQTKSDAYNKMNIAISNGDTERALKMASQTTSITLKMTEDAKTLIKLLGLPWIDVIL
jgi:flap endonuclease-1